MVEKIIDKNYRAHCPNCGGRDWSINPDEPGSRYCQTDHCGYIHSLTGPTISGGTPIPDKLAEKLHAEMLSDMRRDRIRQIAIACVYSGEWDEVDDIIIFAQDLDDAIEALK